MRGKARWALAAAVLLLAAGVFLVIRQEAAEPEKETAGSAALGLMLLDDDQGVYVLAVADQSPADEAGVAPGDYLLQAGGEAILTAEQMNDLAREAWSALELLLLRDEETLLLTMRK